MEYINRDTITDENYRLVLDTETHHDHKLYKDDNGVLRWVENPRVNKYLDKISLNDLCPLLNHLGYDKNSDDRKRKRLGICIPDQERRIWN